MSTETNPQPGTDPQTGSASEIVAPEQLAAAREARGWSKSEAAAKLGMMPRQIDAMEGGRWQDLPGHAFVRGGLRAYGKALQVDVSPLLATLSDPAGMPELRRSASLDSPLPRRGALGFGSGGAGNRLAWILLGLVGVVVIALYFARGTDFDVREPALAGIDAGGAAAGTSFGDAGGAGRGGQLSGAEAAGDEAPAGAPDTGSGAAAPASGAVAGPAESAPAGAGARDERTAASGNAAAAGASGTAGAAAGAAAAGITAGSSVRAPQAGAAPAERVAEGGSAASPEAPARGAGGSVLAFRFERESWVEVRDGDGQVVLRGTQAAGSQREVNGSKPWSMTIGNAEYVRIEQDGNPVDLVSVTQKGVARLRLE